MNHTQPEIKVESNGYVLNYADYVSGWITPEFGYWKDMNEQPGLSLADYPDALNITYLGMGLWTSFDRILWA